MKKPAYGYTKSGQPVHARTIDHHRVDNSYQRFNKWAAIWFCKYRCISGFLGVHGSSNVCRTFLSLRRWLYSYQNIYCHLWV